MSPGVSYKPAPGFSTVCPWELAQEFGTSTHGSFFSDFFSSRLVVLSCHAVFPTSEQPCLYSHPPPPFCSVWHICYSMVDHLCSPVINLFCTSPYVFCLPPSSSSSSVAYLFSCSSVLSDTNCNPPTPFPSQHCLYASRLLPLPHTVLSEKMRGVRFCMIDTLYKNTHQQRVSGVIAAALLRTNLSWIHSVAVKCCVYLRHF